LGYAHTDVADWLTSNWELPASIQLAMVYHHTPAETTQCKNLVALSHFADYLCYQLKLSMGVDSVAPPLDEKSIQPLSISQEHIDKVSDMLAKELDRINIFCELVTAW
jgi:HD-like signal output (HDOD) protein